MGDHDGAVCFRENLFEKYANHWVRPGSSLGKSLAGSVVVMAMPRMFHSDLFHRCPILIFQLFHRIFLSCS